LKQSPRNTGLAPGWAHGLGLRRPFYDQVLDHGEDIDFLELVSENFMSFGGRPRQVAARVSQVFPIVLHGVGLSIGGPDPLNEHYLDRLETLAARTRPRWFSDHLSYSSAYGVEYHDLLPLPFTQEALDHVIPRVRHVQERIGLPFLLENPSTYVRLPGAEMSEASFLGTIAEEADCGILLDINNVYVNAANHGDDPATFLAELPLERVAQVHIAGHDASGSFVVDTHGAAIAADVLGLYEDLVATAPHPFWTLLEWDHHLPPLNALVQELARVREAWSRGHARRAACVAA